MSSLYAKEQQEWIKSNREQYTMKELTDEYNTKFNTKIHHGSLRRESIKLGVTYNTSKRKARIKKEDSVNLHKKILRKSSREKLLNAILSGSASLCWVCDHVGIECSYANDTKPVKGWVATKSRNKQNVGSHMVHKCPNYKGFLGEGFNLDIEKYIRDNEV